MKRIIAVILGGWLVQCAAAATAEQTSAPASFHLDANFPGGNIRVERIEGDTAFVAPDLRDTITNQWWFYWNFRLTAPAGQPVTITFTKNNPLGMRGPAISTDQGVTWQWVGADAVKSSKANGVPAWSFTARVPEGHSEVRYAFCPQYLESHLQTWLAGHSKGAALHIEELCRSRQGRSVELLRAGCLDPRKVRGTVLITSRHHACETMATYALEGLLESVLADDATGRQWREQWQVLAVPFMDKDGVENGDQGKSRAPHDHNRDYNAKPLYPEVAAIMKLGVAPSNQVVAVLDLHCPTIRGEWNDRVYLVGAPEKNFWHQQQAFAAALARVQTGPIRFREKDCLAFGKAWNNNGSFSQGISNSAWARKMFPNAKLVSAIEIAYADALGAEVNAASARALGHDLANALLENLSGK